MSDHPWMPLYVNDFRMDTLDLEPDEIGIYFIMLLLAWRRDDAAIPNDMAWLKQSLKACVANFHGLTFNRIVPKLLQRYFVLGADDKWRNKRLTKERQKARERSEKQSRNSQERWAKHRENKDLVNSNGIPLHSQSKYKRPPKHGDISPSRGQVFIQDGTSDWLAYADDFQRSYGFRPEPNEHRGYWFNIVGAAPLPPPKRQTREH